MLALAVAASPADEAQLAGRWVDSERNVVSELTRSADGVWSGVVVASPRPHELGKRSFQGLIWDRKKARFTGKLLKPDDDQLVDLTLTFVSRDALTGEAGLFIFTRTLHFTRVVAPDAG
ncbi:MAG: hypothetical protein Q8L14_09770 [Myxococcales bacterium]|nr:hypothetical protein [Myxococcales bacterium]